MARQLDSNQHKNLNNQVLSVKTDCRFLDYYLNS